ncbi:hypothetical protein C8J56DRAFT_561765 [Mycena floridula]|nr:hypothetical protein C8J56DRAFT_561765 [Mycena floridula]
MVSSHQISFKWSAALDVVLLLYSNFQRPNTEPSTVIVTGTFDQWSSSLKLVKGDDGFTGTLDISPGEKITFKYIVDGNWTHDPSQPTETDEAGNVNNVYTAPAAEEIKGDEPAAKEVSNRPTTLSDLARTMVAADGTTSGLEYLTSAVGGTIKGYTGVDPWSPIKMSIDSPQTVQFAIPETTDVPEPSISPVAEATPVSAPVVPIPIVPVNAAENNVPASTPSTPQKESEVPSTHSVIPRVLPASDPELSASPEVEPIVEAKAIEPVQAPAAVEPVVAAEPVVEPETVIEPVSSPVAPVVEPILEAPLADAKVEASTTSLETKEPIIAPTEDAPVLDNEVAVPPAETVKVSEEELLIPPVDPNPIVEPTPIIDTPAPTELKEVVDVPAALEPISRPAAAETVSKPLSDAKPSSSEATTEVSKEVAAPSVSEPQVASPENSVVEKAASEVPAATTSEESKVEKVDSSSPKTEEPKVEKADSSPVKNLAFPSSVLPNSSATSLPTSKASTRKKRTSIFGRISLKGIFSGDKDKAKK